MKRFSQFARKSGNSSEPVNTASNKSGGGVGSFFKSGLIILGGLYGYKYFTGDLEDINQYHVSFR